MALTQESEEFLYEIYEAPRPFLSSVIVAGGGGTTLPPNYLPATSTPVTTQLQLAIAGINTSATAIARVEELIVEYKDLSTDRKAKLDTEGYTSTYASQINSIRTSLFPYTGIIFPEANSLFGNSSAGGGGKMKMG